MMRSSLLLLACLTLVMLAAGEADAVDNAIGIHQVDTVWDFGYTGEGISIAVLDTGIDPNHVSLNDFDDDPATNDPKVIAFYDALDDSDDDGSGETYAYDDHGHGSHIAGIIAGTGVIDEGPLSSGEIPYRGVAPGANLVGVKVLDGGGSTSFEEVMRGMEWTIDNRVKYNIRVAYIGPIGEEFTQEQEERLVNLANRMVADGICVVIPAGNSAAYGTIDTLGAAKDVITVGATEDSRELAVYSSKGPTHKGQIKPNVAAIGSAVMSVEANSGDDYVSMSGTSMSAAIVAGISALVAESNPDLSPDEIRIILELTSEYRWLSYPVRPNNDYGWGFVNAADAVTYAAITDGARIDLSSSQNSDLITVNYTKSETEGWNLTSSRYQVGAWDEIFFDLLDNEEEVSCSIERSISGKDWQTFGGNEFCEQNPHWFNETGNFSLFIRIKIHNGSYTLPFYLQVNVFRVLEIAHAPDEVGEGDQFTAWIDTESDVQSVTFYVCTLEEPYTSYKPQIQTREETTKGRFQFTYIVKNNDYPGYKYELERANSTEKIPANEYSYYEGLNVEKMADSYYFKVTVKAEESGNQTENEIVKPVAIAGKDITVIEGEIVQFSGAGTDSDGTIVKYEWDFDGDGIFEWSSEENGISTFFYNDGGEYYTTLKVTDNDGNTATDDRTITVIPDIVEGQQGKDEGESRLPSLSLITTMAAVAVMALRRRPE